MARLPADDTHTDDTDSPNNTVLDATVNWYHGYANTPQLTVLLETIPTIQDTTFQSTTDNTFWYGETNTGVAYFYAGHPDNNGNGFAGRSFTLPTDTGEVTLVGPGDSRAGVANKHGFGPVLDVSMTDDPAVMECGYTFTAGAITLDLAVEAVSLIDGVTLTKRGTTEPTFVPTLTDGSVAAVDNTVVSATFDHTDRVTTVDNTAYTVCRNVHEHATRDRWVVPVTRNAHGTITAVTDDRFALQHGDIIQTQPITR